MGKGIIERRINEEANHVVLAMEVENEKPFDVKVNLKLIWVIYTVSKTITERQCLF